MNKSVCLSLVKRSLIQIGCNPDSLVKAARTEAKPDCVFVHSALLSLIRRKKDNESDIPLLDQNTTKTPGTPGGAMLGLREHADQTRTDA